MDLFQQYLQEALTHLTSDRPGRGLTALRQALLLRPKSPTAHRALLTCCFALGRSPDAIYHGALWEALAGRRAEEGAHLTALIARAGIAYAEMLAGLGIPEAIGLYQGALGRLRQACALAGNDPLLAAMLRAEEGVPVTVAPPGARPLDLHYQDPFLTWSGSVDRRAFWGRLAERCHREGHLVRYTSMDLTAGLLHPDSCLLNLAELESLPLVQAWELTAPLGLEEGRPLRTLTFLQPAEGPMQILVEPWLDRLSARREILLAWDTAVTSAA
jgi:hypothetical protein